MGDDGEKYRGAGEDLEWRLIENEQAARASILWTRGRQADDRFIQEAVSARSVFV